MALAKPVPLEVILLNHTLPNQFEVKGISHNFTLEIFAVKNR